MASIANRKKSILLITAPLIIVLLSMACSLETPLTLQQKIRMFFYEQQSDAADEFVNWADDNLDGYTSQNIYEALYEEGKYHAELGHPNAIIIVSQASRQWARKHGYRYDEKDWQELQAVALENIKTGPAGQLQIWPE